MQTKIIHICIFIILAASVFGCTESRQKAKEHFRQGQIYETEGKNQEALTEYSAAIKSYNGYIPAHRAFQDLKIAMNEREAVLEQYGALLKNQENSPMYCFLYGRILDDSNERIRYYNKALKLDPDYLWAINGLGIEYLKQGNIDEAIKRMMKVIEIDSEFAPVHLSLCRAWYEKGKTEKIPEIAMGRYEVALNEIKKYNQLEPNSWEGFEELGKVLDARKEPRKAIAAFEKAHELNRSKTSPLIYICRIQYREDDIQGCLKTIKNIYTLVPNHIRAKIMEGRCLLRLGDSAGAGKLIAQVLEKEPENPNALEVRGMILFEQKRYAEAKEVFHKLLTIKPGNYEALSKLGVIYDGEKDYKNAVKYLTLAYEAGGLELPQLRILRDRQYLAGEMDGARELSDLICEKDEATPGDWAIAGTLKWQFRLYREASGDFRKALKEENPGTYIPMMLTLMSDLVTEKSMAVVELLSLSEELEGNPLSPVCKNTAFFLKTNYDGVIANLEKKKDGGAWESFILGMSFYKKNNPVKAAAAFGKIEKKEDGDVWALARIVSLLMEGNEKNAAKTLAELDKLEADIGNVMVLAELCNARSLTEEKRKNTKAAKQWMENAENLGAPHKTALLLPPEKPVKKTEKTDER